MDLSKHGFDRLRYPQIGSAQFGGETGLGNGRASLERPAYFERSLDGPTRFARQPLVIVRRYLVYARDQGPLDLKFRRRGMHSRLREFVKADLVWWDAACREDLVQD